MKLTKMVFATAILLVAAALVSAQNRKQLSSDEQSQYVVSAKAGVVNVIEGDVSVKGEKGEWDRVVAGDDLRDGDTVRTGANGRAEILLTPGCYLRLAEDSEFVFAESSAFNLRVKLLKGSAIVEASALDGPLAFDVAKAKFMIVREGLYRFNASASGKAEVAVSKGRVLFDKTLIKGDKKGVVENGSLAVAKFDKDQVDSFDTWSKDRAKTLIAANKRLSRKALRRNGLLASMFGAWVFDSVCGCRTWLPGWYGFSSPYGWSYANCNPWNMYGHVYPYSWSGSGRHEDPKGGGPINSDPRSGRPGGGGTVGGNPGGARPTPVEPPGRGIGGGVRTGVPDRDIPRMPSTGSGRRP
ncbi:MAG TPA: FecR family protein [Blastocatellia bacterium]|nr:FecR family protein [Blastocatellia bacterium]